MMDKLGEEENKRRTLGKQRENQGNQERAELKRLTSRRGSRNSLAIVRLFKGSRKNKNLKEAL